MDWSKISTGGSTAKLLLPVIEGRLADTHLAADFPNAGSDLGLEDGKNNLGFGKFLFFSWQL